MYKNEINSYSKGASVLALGLSLPSLSRAQQIPETSQPNPIVLPENKSSVLVGYTNAPEISFRNNIKHNSIEASLQPNNLYCAYSWLSSLKDEAFSPRVSIKKNSNNYAAYLDLSLLKAQKDNAVWLTLGYGFSNGEALLPSEKISPSDLFKKRKGPYFKIGGELRSPSKFSSALGLEYSLNSSGLTQEHSGLRLYLKGEWKNKLGLESSIGLNHINYPSEILNSIINESCEVWETQTELVDGYINVPNVIYKDGVLTQCPNIKVPAKVKKETLVQVTKQTFDYKNTKNFQQERKEEVLRAARNAYEKNNNIKPNFSIRLSYNFNKK